MMIMIMMMIIMMMVIMIIIMALMIINIVMVLTLMVNIVVMKFVIKVRKNIMMICINWVIIKWLKIHLNTNNLLNSRTKMEMESVRVGIVIQ